MKWKTFIALAIVVAAIFSGFTFQTGKARFLHIQISPSDPITVNHPADQDKPRVYGDYIIYRDDRSGGRDIYMYDLSTETETHVGSLRFAEMVRWFYDTYADRIVYLGTDGIHVYYILTGSDTTLSTETLPNFGLNVYQEFIVWESPDFDIYTYNLGTGQEIQITDDPAYQRFPAIFGNRIVWHDGRVIDGSGYIWVHDLSTGEERPLPSGGLQLDIYGDRVIWNAHGHIYMYDFRSGYTREIIPDLRWDTLPAICGDRVVYERQYDESTDIYMYDLARRRETQITHSGSAFNPNIYGDRIVYEDERNGNWDVYMYDLSTQTETLITTKTVYANQECPDVYSDIVVWQDDRHDNFDIYMCHIRTGTETQVTTDPADQISPAIFGDYIVWEDYRNGDADIYMYHIPTRTETQVTRDPADQVHPAIGDRYITGWEEYNPVVHTCIVWEDYRNGDADIYVYDLLTETERLITPSNANQTHPAVDQWLVAYEDDRSGENIYVYDLKTDTEIQITTHTMDGPYARVPDIWRQSIVWIDNRTVKPNVYMYNLFNQEERQISSSRSYAWLPSISGYRIVWEDRRLLKVVDIYMYDLLTETTTRLTGSDTRDLGNPVVFDGSHVIYHVFEDGSWDIYLHPLGTRLRIAYIRWIIRCCVDPEEIPSGDFRAGRGGRGVRRENLRNAVVNRLEAVEKRLEAVARRLEAVEMDILTAEESRWDKISSTAYKSVIGQLSSLLAKTDGYAERGTPDVVGSGYTPDWIITNESQQKVDPLLREVIDLLETGNETKQGKMLGKKCDFTSISKPLKTHKYK